jgi:hypothetical protein
MEIKERETMDKGDYWEFWEDGEKAHMMAFSLEVFTLLTTFWDN